MHRQTNTDELMLLESKLSLHCSHAPGKVSKETAANKCVRKVVWPTICHQSISWPLDQLLSVVFYFSLACLFVRHIFCFMNLLQLFTLTCKEGGEATQWKNESVRRVEVGDGSFTEGEGATSGLMRKREEWAGGGWGRVQPTGRGALRQSTQGEPFSHSAGTIGQRICVCVHLPVEPPPERVREWFLLCQVGLVLSDPFPAVDSTVMSGQCMNFQFN